MGRWRYHKVLPKGWSRVPLAGLLLLWAGCGDGAKLLKADEHGGVAVYPYRSEVGHMATRFRGDAIALIEQHCPHGYRIVKEGGARGRAQSLQQGVSSEMVVEQRWGIQFECK